jgi:hypothetical protein
MEIYLAKCAVFLMDKKVLSIIKHFAFFNILI